MCRIVLTRSQGVALAEAMSAIPDWHLAALCSIKGSGTLQGGFTAALQLLVPYNHGHPS